MFSSKSMVLGLSVVTILLATGEMVVAQTGWNPRVIVSAAEREQLKKTPIHLRPNRPLHFYGNTVRRQYYRNHPKTAGTSQPNLQPKPNLLPNQIGTGSPIAGKSPATQPAVQPSNLGNGEPQPSFSILEFLDSPSPSAKATTAGSTSSVSSNRMLQERQSPTQNKSVVTNVPRPAPVVTNPATTVNGVNPPQSLQPQTNQIRTSPRLLRIFRRR